MKTCSSCGLPVNTTKKIVTDVWTWVLNQEFSADVKITKHPRSIEYTQGNCQFVLKIVTTPTLKAVEEWKTPFGSIKNLGENNQEALGFLYKWYRALKQDERVNIIEVIAQEGLLELETSDRVCTVCEAKPRKAKGKRKRKPAAKKKITVITEVSADVKAALKERDLVLNYLKANILETKKRHLENIGESLSLGTSKVIEILAELEKEGKVQREFKFFDYYIPTSHHNSETARKQFEILDYLKQHIDCPSTKCTQFSLSLSFDLPFALIGFILNDMIQNRLISKESIDVTKDGETRKVACYIPSSY
ncbi:MAG: hypothetical protein JSV04_11905 [Candidatus Heimdallarchaeota archaeon]|nr:MAG: hypothetical protein JSV04_11905 [Candidatus Heimdallarchaeota archaeon]